MDIQKVLVADAVDSSCVDILKQHGILVDCNYKLSKPKLIEVIKVRYILQLLTNINNKTIDICLCLYKNFFV